MERIHPDLVPGLMKAPVFVVRSWNRRLLRLGFHLMRAGRVEGVRTTDERFGEVPVRVHVPDNPSGAALLWIHGGGYVIGTAGQDDRRCARFARELGLRVVSVDYRLAPEHPFPAPLDDCHAAWRHLVDNAPALGLDPERLIIGGESAGGGLAATLVQRIHDEGGQQPLAQVLVYPMLDDRTATRPDIGPKRHRVWCNQSNVYGWSSYLSQPPGGDDVPSYAVGARRDHLSGLPPAWIGVGTEDLFFDEDRTYAERLRAAGVDCQLDVIEGAYHGFVVVDPDAPVSRAFLAAQIAFMGEQLGIEPG
jgi:acetyl esterase/lipase